MIVASDPSAIPQARVAASRPPTRLLVVDDHAAVRAGIRDVLADEPGFDVVAALATAEEALSVAERGGVDVAVVDYQLGGRTGLWLSRKLKRLGQPPGVLIYSAYADDVLAAAAVVAEADGVISKAELGSELCDAIRAVARGGHRLQPVAPWLSEALRNRFGHEEQAIFGMLLAGIPRDEIAETLGMSAGGLDSRLWAMLRALESPRAEAPAARAMGGSRLSAITTTRHKSERSSDMRSIKRESVPVVIEGDGVEVRLRDEDGLSVGFFRLPAGADLRPAVAGLPDDLCPCPHWGYMIKGRVRMHTADGHQDFVAGEAFYWAPGHAPEAIEDSEYVDFSPTEEFRPVIDHITARAGASA